MKAKCVIAVILIVLCIQIPLLGGRIAGTSVNVPVELVVEHKSSKPEILHLDSKAQIQVEVMWLLSLANGHEIDITGNAQIERIDHVEHLKSHVPGKTSLGIGPQITNIKSARLAVMVTPTRSCPYKGDAQYSLTQLQKKGGKIQIPVRRVVLHYGPAQEVTLQLRSGLTGKPLANRRVRPVPETKSEKAVAHIPQTDQHGLFKALSYQSAPEITVTGSSLDRGQERIGTITVSAKQIKQYHKDHKPIIITTLQPWFVGHLRLAEKTGKRPPDVKTLDGIAEVCFRSGSEVLFNGRCDIHAGSLLLYQDKRYLAGCTGEVTRLKGPIADHYMLEKNVQFKVPALGKHGKTSIDVVPRHKLPLSLLVKSAITNKPIAKAKVSVEGSQNQPSSVQTGVNGSARVEGLARDEYELSVSASGYRSKRVYHVMPGSNKPVVISLTPTLDVPVTMTGLPGDKPQAFAIIESEGKSLREFAAKVPRGSKTTTIKDVPVGTGVLVLGNVDGSVRAAKQITVEPGKRYNLEVHPPVQVQVTVANLPAKMNGLPIQVYFKGTRFPMLRPKREVSENGNKVRIIPQGVAPKSKFTLPPGSYEVELGIPSSLSGVKSVVLGVLNVPVNPSGELTKTFKYHAGDSRSVKNNNAKEERH